MKVTAVEPQKRAGRYNVYIDNEFWCGVSENTLVKYSIFPKKIIEKDKLDPIFEYEIFNKLYDASIGKLARRPHSISEIKKYISNKLWKNKKKWFSDTRYYECFDELSKKLIRKTINKLEKNGYLNDKDFARWFVDSRKNSNRKGWLAIKSELILKGVPKEIIDQLVLTREEEIELAEKLYLKINRVRSISREKVISRLASRGFTWDTIQTIIDKYEVDN